MADALVCLALELEMLTALGRGELTADDIEQARMYLSHREPLERVGAAQLLPAMVMNELLAREQEVLFRAEEEIRALPTEAIVEIMRRHLWTGW